MLLHELFEATARRLPDKTALVIGTERVTFGAIGERAERLSAAFARLGIERGDRIAILGDSTLETVIAIWAALEANAVFMVLSPTVRRDKLSYILQDSGARVLVGS